MDDRDDAQTDVWTKEGEEEEKKEEDDEDEEESEEEEGFLCVHASIRRKRERCYIGKTGQQAQKDKERRKVERLETNPSFLWVTE